MPNALPCRTSEEMDAAARHLTYEIGMAFFTGWAALTAPKGTAQRDLRRYALLESFTVHLRNLDYFLFRPVAAISGKPRKEPMEDDIVAGHFVSSARYWLADESPPALGSATGRVHKEVAHLTFARQRSRPEADLWEVRRLLASLAEALVEFLRRADHPSLDPFRADIEQAITWGDKQAASQLWLSAGSPEETGTASGVTLAFFLDPDPLEHPE